MWGSAEWEVVDDDGFVYKRRKRNEVLSSPVTIAKSQEPVLSDKAQLRVRDALARRKKMAVLLAQKELYAAEIADWENLLKRQEDAMACAPILQSPPSPELLTVRSMDDATSNDDLRILDLQVEACEGFLEQLKGFRDQGESMCKKLEMKVEARRIHAEQDVFKEVAKFTPRTIIHSLTSDQDVPLPVPARAGKSLLGRPVASDGYKGGQIQQAE